MNRRRKIYKGFNRKRRVKINRYIVVIICTCIVGGYTYYKLKDTKIVDDVVNKVSTVSNMNFIDKIPIINKLKEKRSTAEITYKDISKELEEIDDKKNDKKNEKEVSSEVKIGIIDGWSIYTIQVASISNPNETEKIKDKLDSNKIPFSMMDKDGAKKVQTYSFFNENATRSYLNQTQKIFPDAFITKLDIPTLSLEYTQKYNYIEFISKDLNNLVSNFKQESEFWEKNVNSVDMSKYNMILTKRKEIIEKIEKNATRIDYKEMNQFKNNLMAYTKKVDEAILVSSKSANEGNYNESKSLYISSMQGYLLFINSIRSV